uniref:MLH3 n=1 Tax=Trichomonas vaginalis TaxID=5722 RepID=A9NIQ6_TRIVA|nr:MLH3-like protein [Trichomonas vaginalis]AEW27283.1 MLH3 [Trichomonas vaginalis]
MSELIDHSAIASELVMNSIDANAQNITVTLDLLLNQILVTDDGEGIQNLNAVFIKGGNTNLNGVYKRNKSHLSRLISICDVDILSKTKDGKIQRKTFGDEHYIDNYYESGTTILLTKIFSNNLIRIKEFTDPKNKLSLINRFKRFICTISLRFPHISFIIFSSCQNQILNLPKVESLEKRFIQITGVKPQILPDGKIMSFVDFSLNSFENFLVNDFPCNRLFLGYEEVKINEKCIQVKEGSVIDYIWDRDGLTVMLSNENQKVTKNFDTNEVGDVVIRNLEYVCVWDRKFILATFQNKLYSIDQHAAHERINLSKLMKRCFTERYPKTLKRPMMIHESFGISFNEKSYECLRKWGWRFNCKEVTAVPCVCGVEIDDADGMIKYAIQCSTGNEPEIPDCILDALRTRACKTAIKFGEFIDEIRAKSLIYELSISDRPNHCAHGRTVVAPILDFDRPFSKFDGI